MSYKKLFKAMLKNKETIFLILILLLGAGLRFWGINWGLPYEYQTEEYRVIKYALKMGGTGDLNPHMFIYPSLYLYFMLFVYGCYYIFGRIFGAFSSTTEFAHQFIIDPTCFYLLGRFFESLFGLGIIFLTYLIGKRIFSKNVGLLSAFLVAILPVFVNKAHIAKGDMAGVMLGLLFFYFVYRIYETGKLKYYILSGVFLGLAFSTKYYLLIMGIALPAAHFLSPVASKHRYFFFSLFLIPIFFIVGTPYAILSKEFVEEFQISVFNFGGGSGEFWKGFDLVDYLKKIGTAIFMLVRMNDIELRFWFGSFGTALFSLLGLLWLYRTKKHLAFLFIAPIICYLFAVGLMPMPAAGYFIPLFPLLAILVATFFFYCWGQRRWIKVPILILAAISIISELGESALVSYSYTLKDTRTIAKEWIENNIHSGKKVLMDFLPQSPPLKMSTPQLRKFYEKAVELDHYKKEYFKLKLETAKPEDVCYEIFVIQRTAKEMGTHPKLLEEVQKTQDLVRLQGDETDFKTLKKLGIEYVIANSKAEAHAQTHHPAISSFYQLLPEKSKLLKIFLPKTRLHPGPEIRIYQLSPSLSPPFQGGE